MSDILVEVAEAVPVEVNLPAKDNAIEMEVYYQDEVSLDTDLSLFYIKSGEKEIENYVEGVAKPEIDNYIEAYAKPIVSEVVDSIATPIIDEYFEETVKPSITEFANKEMAGYAAEATAQAAIATESAALAANTAQSVDAKVAEFSEQIEVSKQEFIAFAGEKTEEFEQTAQQATAGSLANVEKARIWAEGEQAEVETLGGELSSRGFADFAYAIANAPEDVPLDNSNLIALDIIKGEKGDKGDKGDAGKDGVDGKSVFDGYATNCITEIPQDIKLELNNSVATLKAGSKVYDGNGIFKEVTSDISLQISDWSDVPHFLFVKENGELYGRRVDQSSSGEQIPTSGWSLYYNTQDKKLYQIDNGVNVGTGSFPIAKVSIANGSAVSIDQVFNGFGYIGSTVFALPGVKGLIPNGRNADGSLKNIEFVFDRVICRNFSFQAKNVCFNIFDGTFGSINGEYNAKENLFTTDGTNRLIKIADCVANSSSPYNITSFTPKQAFHAVDRNDSSWIARQGMPSGKYIDLTLGASGSSYTAPANGFVQLSASKATQVDLSNTSTGIRNGYGTQTENTYRFTFIPVKKGDKFTAWYTITTFDCFRFIYAEGENS